MSRPQRVRDLRKAEAQRRSPTTNGGWHRLLLAVLARARVLGDRREKGLAAVLKDRNRIPGVLRKMGIICETDIMRVFPDPKT